MRKWLQWGRRSQKGEDFIICRFNWAVLIVEVLLQMLFATMMSLVLHLPFIVSIAVITPFALLAYAHFWKYSVIANLEEVSLQHGSWPFKLSWKQIYSYKEETESTFKARKISFAEGLNSHLNLDPDYAINAVIRFIAFFDEQGKRVGRLPLTFIPQGDKANILQIIETAVRRQEEIRKQEADALRALSTPAAARLLPD